MTPPALVFPSGLFRLQCHLKSLFLPPSIPNIKAFSSSLTLDTEETPAMKALKDIPYPSASSDPSIFESRSDEYDRVRLPRVRDYAGRVALRRSADQHYNASRILEQLSRAGRFEEAEQVRQELAEMNVPIRPSRWYFRLAWNVLRLRPCPPNRSERFINWLSLFPSKTRDKTPLNIALLSKALLFDSRNLDIKTISQFGVVLSSKGYIRTMGHNVVACLTRYANPDISSRVLDEMIAADDDYRRRENLATNKSIRQAKETTRRLWSIAVRIHCTTGRPEVAFQLAKRAHEHDFVLTQFTYEYLLGKLDADGLDDLTAELRAHPYCESLDVAKNRLKIVDPTSIAPISRKHTMAKNLENAMAILKAGSRSTLPAYAVDLVPYFDIYKTHLRGAGATNALRADAYRYSLTATSAVLLAELLHHHRRGQFRHVLWVFERFFNVVGVSSEDIKRQLWKREHYPPDARIPPSHLPHHIKNTTINLRAGLWPTHHHTALVWSSLVHLCGSEEELFTLYDSLLQHSARFQKSTVDHHRHYRHHHPSHGSSNGNVLAPVNGPNNSFDAAHFLPFLIAFTHLRDPKHGLRILDDLQDRGIAPSAQILSTTAALQARLGEPALALRLLDLVRDLVEQDEDEVVNVGEGVRVWERVKKRQQLLLAYTSVLRGLVDRGDAVQARRVGKLIRSHLGYVEDNSVGGGVNGEGGGGDGGNGNVRTDAALRYLRCLEVEGPGALSKPLPDSEVDANYRYPFLKRPDPEVRSPKKLIYSKSHSPYCGSVSNPHASLSFFPLGENRFALCYFYFLLKLMEVTAQLIKALNAAPGRE